MSERGPGSTSTEAEGRAFKAEAQKGFRELMRQIQKDKRASSQGMDLEPADVDDEDEEIGAHDEPAHTEPEQQEPISSQQTLGDADFAGLSGYEVNRRIDYEEMLRQRVIIVVEAQKKSAAPKKKSRPMTQGEIDFFGIHLK